MHLNSLTNEELISYISNMDLTDIEQEFVRRFCDKTQKENTRVDELEEELEESEGNIYNLEDELADLRKELDEKENKIKDLEELAKKWEQCAKEQSVTIQYWSNHYIKLEAENKILISLCEENNITHNAL